MTEPMAPEELDALLSAHLDGELDAESQRRVVALLERPEVAARLAALRGVDAALRSVPDSPVPPSLLARVRDAAAAEEAAGSRARLAPPRRRRWLRTAALVAAAAALLLWIASLGDRRSPEERAPIARTPAPVAPGPEGTPQVAPPPREYAVRPETPEPTPETAPVEVAGTPELSDEEVALAVGVESLDDLELLENLELLEQLGELEDWG